MPPYCKNTNICLLFYINITTRILAAESVFLFDFKLNFFNYYRMVGSRVYVGGLPYGVRERDLERFFKGYGRTRDILIKNGYGFVVSYKIF